VELGDEMSESTEQSLRSIEKKLDALTSEMRSELRLVTQRLEMYDVESMKRGHDQMREDVVELKANVRVGAVVAVIVLGAVVALLFQAFTGAPL
jgi:hypothetical protein